MVVVSHSIVKEFNPKYNKNDWRSFIDSSKVSLKVVLLHNRNKFPSVPLGPAATMKETYQTMKLLL